MAGGGGPHKLFWTPTGLFSSALILLSLLHLHICNWPMDSISMRSKLLNKDGNGTVQLK